MSRFRIIVVTMLAAGILATSAQAQQSADSPVCSAPDGFTRLSEPLFRVAYRLTRHEAIKILAIGSSSTAGVGASTIDTTYPSRLERDLHALLPGVPVQIINRGVSGEDASEMLKRLQQDLVEEHPDLVLWQVGTNAILRNDGIALEAPLIREGLRRIRTTGADALLIDPQYAPKVLRDPDAKPMVALMSLIGYEMGVPVFRRFALMRHWREERGIPYEIFLSSDLFHMNDWSYGCMAKSLAAAIAGTVAPAYTARKSEAGNDTADTGNAAEEPRRGQILRAGFGQ